jgi:hypothetical protein
MKSDITKRLMAVIAASRELSCRPRDISDALYRRQLDERHAVFIGNRWFLRQERLDDIRNVLVSLGKLPAAKV